MRDIFVGGYSFYLCNNGTAFLPFYQAHLLVIFVLLLALGFHRFYDGKCFFGLYNVSKIQTNSYFNYTPENDENYYIACHPLSLGKEKQPHQKRKKDEQAIIAKKKEIPRVGALIVGEGKDLHIGFPAFWVGQNEVGIVLASIKF